MPPPPDLPQLLAAIRENPDDGRPWLALASWLWDNGRDDEADVVRVLWPTLQDNPACAAVAATPADPARNATVLARVARHGEPRADETARDG